MVGMVHVFRCHKPNLSAIGPAVMTSLTFLFCVFVNHPKWPKFSFVNMLQSSYQKLLILVTVNRITDVY